MTTPAQAMVGELRALLEKATPGPWTIRTLENFGFNVVHYLNGNKFDIQRVAKTGGESDAALIAAAVNALPKLLDLIESLSARAAGVDLASIWELARSINDSDALMKVYAAPEWGELSNDGKTWVAALVAETLRRERSDELAYFGASEFAPYAFPGEDQQALRDAFCQGASLPSKPGGADREREAIVAWLRESASHHLAAIQPFFHESTVRELEQTAEDYEILADCIERGNHLASLKGEG